MCMLSFIPGGIEIEEQDLLNGGIQNADGSGWAIAAHDQIIMGKSMKVEEALEEFVETRKQFPECDSMFHSRWATHGTTSIANVHPFPVGGSHKTVVGHNGILSCKPGKDDWRSDTRILADEHLPTRYRRFDKPRAMEALTNFIGPNNKLVILTVDKRYKKNAYIVNEKAGNWDSVTGVWHSNYDYIGYSAKYPYWQNPKSYSSTWQGNPTYRKNEQGVYVADYSKSDNCVFCNYGIVGKSGYCMECGTCADCMQEREECQCYAGYYNSFDWNAQAISRKALDCPRENGIPTIGYRSTADKDYARGGMELNDIMDQIDHAIIVNELEEM